VNDLQNIKLPVMLQAIVEDTALLGFTMSSDIQTGCLLRTLAATKPQGRFLELGTGTGCGTAWILEGMDAHSTLDTVDINPNTTAVAKKHLAKDQRVTFHLVDGVEFLQSAQGQMYDFIFADTWAGKYERFDLALKLLNRGGILVFDDMLPQASWPEEHFPKVADLLSSLDAMTDYKVVKMNWSTGIVIITKGA
jgi:predicted O-methyltransferase YrrM